MTQQSPAVLPALAGLRVLDMGRILSGPLCGRILADLGAEVIKIEPPSGDDGRHFGPFYEGQSSYYRLLNRNKFGIVLDLKDDAHRQTLADLIARSDVLIENFRPGVMARFGFSAEEIAEINPRMVVVSISGFGQSGPLASAPAYDLIVQAMSGLMSVTGAEGGDPARVGVSIGDMVPALYATISILAALRQRDVTGRGQHIDIAMFDSLVSLLESVGMRALLSDEPVVATGSHHAISAPFGTFATADQPIAIAVANDVLFARLGAALDRPDWSDDPRFATDEDRGRNRHALQREIEGALAGRSRDDAIAVLSAAGVPCGPVLDVREVLAHEQVAARRLVRTEADGFRTLATPFELAGRGGPDRLAPRLGEHDGLVAEWTHDRLRTGIDESEEL